MIYLVNFSGGDARVVVANDTAEALGLFIAEVNRTMDTKYQVKNTKTYLNEQGREERQAYVKEPRRGTHACYVTIPEVIRQKEMFV